MCARSASASDGILSPVGSGAAVLAWSWTPVEMYKIGGLITDWRNMAEFGSAFLKPNFHDWSQYLSDMVVTVQIAIWGTALSLSPDGTYAADPSHPAFYLPGQNLETPNFRSVAVLDP